MQLRDRAEAGVKPNGRQCRYKNGYDIVDSFGLDGSFKQTGPSMGVDLEFLLHLWNSLGLRARLSSGPYMQSWNLSLLADLRYRMRILPLSLYASIGFFPWSMPMVRYSLESLSYGDFKYVFTGGLGLEIYFDQWTKNAFLKRLVLDAEFGAKVTSSDSGFFGASDLFVALKLGFRIF